jgi:hypothetical protein
METCCLDRRLPDCFHDHGVGLKLPILMKPYPLLAVAQFDLTIDFNSAA